MTVFLDTVGLLAIWDESDQWHQAAQRCFAGLLASRSHLITSTSILLECGNAAARRPYRSAVNRLRKEMEDAGDLIAPTSEDWQAAWSRYEKRDADSAGIVDHLSFSILRRLGLTKAFTNDAHFRVAGFETLF